MMLSMPKPYLDDMVLMLQNSRLLNTPAAALVDGFNSRQPTRCAAAWSSR
jgi:hypothetical protein